mgnify:CR=1 FL=1
MRSYNQINQAFIYLFFILVSVLFGFKSEIVGADASRYIKIFFQFHDVDIYWFIDRIKNLNLNEIGFLIFVKLSSEIYLDSFFFFFTVSLSITFLIYFSYKSLVVSNNIHHDLFFISVLLLSSWYITETTNGIKQGLALSILYFGLCKQLVNSNYNRFIILFFTSCLFHISIILILPFLLIIRFRLKYVYIFWFISLFFYIIGLNELIVKTFSEYFDIKVYTIIKEYGLKENPGNWVGLQWEFVLYTFVYGLLPIILKILNLIKLEHKTNLEFTIKLYLMLSIVYFTFGFGPWSNRFAIICWFFIPILQASLFANVKFSKKSLQLISIILMLVSINYFIFYRLQFL